MEKEPLRTFKSSWEKFMQSDEGMALKTGNC